MSKVISNLKDCQITDAGEVLVKYDTLITRIRCGQPIDGLTALPHDDVDFYNRRHPGEQIKTKLSNGDQGYPSVEAFDFVIPRYHQELDLDEFLCAKLADRFPNDIPEPYILRLVDELDMMRVRGMENFLRTLIYISDEFERHGVVHGIGRGSACASLILFLIDIHMVDPIVHEIPIGEFLR